MRRTAMAWGLLIAGFCAGTSALPAQDIVQAHGLLRNQASCEEPQRIVVTLPPPRVEVADRCSRPADEPRKKCCLFTRHHKSEGTYRGGAVADVLWAPAALPTMLVSGAVQQPALTQQITHDFSGLRTALEMDVQAAGLAAHLAARNAMVNAENEAMQQIMERARGKMAALSSAMPQPSLAADKADASRVPLDTALRNLNTRLDRLEELVLLHQQAIDALKKVSKKE